MRQFVLLSILSVLAFGSPAVADTPKDQDHVRIETNTESGTITFFIDNKPAIQINRDGLYVVESIVYGKTIADTGPAHVKKLISSVPQEKGGRNE